MKNGFACVDGGALKIKGTDLFVLPHYRTQKEDPNVRTVLAFGLDPADKAAILAEHKTGEITKAQLTAKSHIWLVSLSEGLSQFAMKSVLGGILKEIEASGFTSVVIGQLGLIEYGCDDEERWKRVQNAEMEAFAAKHPGMSLTMVVPGDDYRPQEGRHFGDGIIPEEGDGGDPEDIAPSSTHHQIALNTRAIKSYCDYLEQYIDARNRQMELINTHSGATIEDLGDLRFELKEYEGRDRVENFRKWAHAAPKKKGRGEYFPAPSKQKLKLMILLLDMSYDEAAACLSFFGYGLARFDRADMAFAYILKTNEGAWSKPVDVREVDKSLCRRFGSAASIIAKVNKKG